MEHILEKEGKSDAFYLTQIPYQNLTKVWSQKGFFGPVYVYFVYFKEAFTEK